MTSRLIKILLAVSVQIFIAPSCFSQDFAFKCCNEYNSHKSTCKNYNELQEWEIVLDSLIYIQDQKRIKSNFSGIAKIKLNRSDSTFNLTLNNQNSIEPYLHLVYKYKYCNWITDCYGNELPELGVSLEEMGKEILFGGYYWSESDCDQPDFYIQFTTITYNLYGRVKVIDE